MVGFCLHGFSVSLFKKFLCLSSFALQKNKKKTHTKDCVVLSPASKCVFKCLSPNLKTQSRLRYVFDVKHYLHNRAPFYCGDVNSNCVLNEVTQKFCT